MVLTLLIPVNGQTIVLVTMVATKVSGLRASVVVILEFLYNPSAPSHKATSTVSPVEPSFRTI